VAWLRDRGDVRNRDQQPLSDQSFYEWTWRGDVSVIAGKTTSEFGGEIRNVRQGGSSVQFVYVPALVPSRDAFNGSGTQSVAYVQESIALGARGHFIAGLRQQHFTASTEPVTTPYASLSIQLRQRTRVDLNWGQYGQFPELSQLFSMFALRPLLPERATH